MAAETAAPTAAKSSLRSHSFAVAVIGMIFYAVLISGIMLAPDAYPLGMNIYDEYYLALMEGRLDLPARVVQFEGHYAADGTAYLYHGAAPLLTRFVLGWVWPFDHMPLGRFSIWLWACAGTAFYHAAFFCVAQPHLAKLGSTGASLARLLAFAIWFGGAGLLASANATVYHEPIAVAYAAAGAFLLIAVLNIQNRISVGTALILMAVCAALALHARPNIAIGLYIGTLISGSLAARQGLKKHWICGALALAIMGASGLSYLGLNSVKFGSATEAHGTFSKSGVQYGFVFWGNEDENSERAQAFKKHGKFNLRRIPHNGLLYFVDVPAVTPKLADFGETLRAGIKDSLASELGFIRVELPTAGLIFLWPFWIALGTFMFSGGSRPLIAMSAPLAAGLVIFLLTTAYGTVTFRYRIDLWPFIAVCALIGMGNLLPRLTERRLSAPLKTVLAVTFLVGTLTTSLMGVIYQNLYTNHVSKPLWSPELCHTLSSSKGFSEEDTRRICRDGRIQYQ